MTVGVLHKAVLATTLIGAGLASTTGAAFAQGSDWDGGTVQKGLVNSSDFAPNTPVDVCNIDVPVNALGVQVPVQDNAGTIPLLGAKTGSAGIAKSCANPIAADN
jgi:hypothetical protein